MSNELEKHKLETAKALLHLSKQVDRLTKAVLDISKYLSKGREGEQ